jgi:hypothetical protein
MKPDEQGCSPDPHEWQVQLGRWANWREVEEELLKRVKDVAQRIALRVAPILDDMLSRTLTPPSAQIDTSPPLSTGEKAQVHAV